MRSTITIILSFGFLILAESCHRPSQGERAKTVKELKRLDQGNARIKDNAMQGIVPEPKPAKDVIFH